MTSLTSSNLHDTPCDSPVRPMCSGPWRTASSNLTANSQDQTLNNSNLIVNTTVDQTRNDSNLTEHLGSDSKQLKSNCEHVSRSDIKRLYSKSKHFESDTNNSNTPTKNLNRWDPEQIALNYTPDQQPTSPAAIYMAHWS